MGSAALPALQAMCEAFVAARDEVSREERELATASDARIQAYEEADRRESAARYYVYFLAADRPELNIEPRNIFPVQSPSRRDESAEAELDQAGVPPFELN